MWIMDLIDAEVIAAVVAAAVAALNVQSECLCINYAYIHMCHVCVRAQTVVCALFVCQFTVHILVVFFHK